VQTANGGRGTVVARPSTHDPRQRPWFTEARKSGGPTMTEPYEFASTGVSGISAALPLRAGGVLGVDFTPGTLSRLLFEYKPTPNSIIIAAPQSGNVFIESDGCIPTAPDCLSGDAEVRAAMRKTIVEARGSEPHIEHDFEAAGRSYREFVHIMPPALGKRLTIAAAVPLSELDVDSRSLLQRSAVAALLAVALAILAVLIVSLLLSRSLARMAGKTERIRNLDFSDNVPVTSRITEILRLSETIEQMRAGLEIFGRYVSKDLVRQIMRAPHRQGGTRGEFTVMFTDIEGFSLISETVEPALLFARLSRYFEVMGRAISANRGMIDKYIGDGIMAFWNAPEPDDDHIAHACRAALQAAAASRDLAAKWRMRGRPVFRTRLGLHTGPAIVGNLGARDRINYTLVGAVANEASRLEGLNKVYRTEILASAAVATATADRFVWRHIDLIVAAGTTEMLDIYEPLGEGATRAEHAGFLSQWDGGRAAYVEGRFDDAIAFFRAAAELRPDDGPCRLFIERCGTLSRDGLPAGWDGAWHFVKK
jgi:adenylate cyclase